MEIKSKFTGFLYDAFNKKFQFTFEAKATDVNREAIQEEFIKYKDQDLKLKASKYKPKRSLDANAYYWQLLHKLAGKEKVSSRWLHNDMLRECAVPQTFDGQVVFTFLPDTDEAAKTADESETYHIKPTSQIRPGKDGDPDYRAYILLKGSSEFDTAEMSRLIDALVQRCKESGIETLPPDEIERMKAMWK